jgi:hypothetical protein
MAAYSIITNNPMVYDRFRIICPDIIWVNAPVQETLTAARGAIQKGAILLSHPLSDKIKPGLSPYKSIIVSKPQTQVDFQSVRNIEESINVYKKNAKLKYLSFNDKVLNDFQLIDLDLIASALSGLPQEYRG